MQIDSLALCSQNTLQRRAILANARPLQAYVPEIELLIKSLLVETAGPNAPLPLRYWKLSPTALNTNSTKVPQRLKLSSKHSKTSRTWFWNCWTYPQIFTYDSPRNNPNVNTQSIN